MDASEIKTEWTKPSENPLENLSQDDIKKLLEYRTEILVELNHHYKALIEAIMKQPLHVIYRQHAFMNIDQGMHWLKTAIDNVWELPVVESEKQEPESEATNA